MIDELIEDFANSPRVLSDWRDYIWDLRLEEEPRANKARAAAYERCKALRRESDEPASMRAQPAMHARKTRPVTASEVFRVLRAG